jgi:hypothetical protein
MRNFWKNCKGAVTVMVTLLLIPAILVSGTGVDLARVYAARSTLQDANQLAGNAVLTEYDALLQDLYGLFAVMQGDVDMDSVASTYVSKAVNGEDWKDTGTGTFQLFYGSNLSTSVKAATNMNLGETDVLRRQIEEYAKYRAPAVIVEQILGKLDTFEKVQEDAKVIKKKLEVDDQVEEVDEWYRKVYNCIVNLNECDDDEEDATKKLSSAASDIQNSFGEMAEIKEEYAKKKEELEKAEKEYEQAEQDYADAEDDETADEVKKKMEELKEKIEKLTEEMETLKNDYEDAISDIIARSATWSEQWESYDQLLYDYIYDKDFDSLEKLWYLCEDAENAKDGLEKDIEELEESLNSGKCSTALQQGLTEAPTDENGDPVKDSDGQNMKSVIDQYKDLLAYDLNDMIQQEMYSLDGKQIQETRDILKDASLGDEKILDLKDKSVSQLLSEYPLEDDSETDCFAGVLAAQTTFSPASPGFQEFQSSQFDATKNGEFYKELDKLYRENAGDEQGKNNVKNSITKIFKKVKSVFAEGLAFTPEGAESLQGAENDSDASTGSDFGTNDEYDWGNEDEGKEELESALDSDFLSLLASAANSMGNKILLLTYDTEMFSDYSSQGKEEGYELNMAGITLSPDVNYYFQSELEYLYNGNLEDAIANLKSVAGMIFLIRFVFDYVASFSVTSVNTMVNTIKAALAWTGPFAILTGELARLAMALGESTLDVSRLREGDEVALYKNNQTWKFSLTGLLDVVTEEITEEAIGNALNIENASGNDNSDDQGVSLSYTDYLRLFLLLVDGDTLAERTCNLIELNVTNKRNSINADEEKMAAATRVDLSNGVVAFTMTTTAELRMLFLSLPIAQKGVNGVIPSETLTISATDYRGY